MFEAMNDKEIWKVYTRKSDTLFVWFGGINEPFFSEKFAETSGFDCLYFRDLGFDWYVNGLSGTSLSSEQFAQAIRAFSRPRYKFVCFGGQSSGGYAALFYGLACNADLCIPFSPQTRNTFNGQCSMTPHVKLADITELYRARTERPLVVLNVSRSERQHRNEYEWRDHDQIVDLKFLDGITTIIHPHDNHAVSVRLRSQGILYQHLVSLVATYRSLKAVFP